MTKSHRHIIGAEGGDDVAEATVLRVVIQRLEDGPGYLAICPDLQGCHAEGATIGAALDAVRAVAATLVALRREDGLPLPPAGPQSGGVFVDGQLTVTVG